MKYGDIMDDHEYMTPEHRKSFLRNHRTGIDNFGRQALGKIIEKHDNPTVLDAACGTAVNWEVFKRMGVACQYTGLDSTQGLLDTAAEFYGDQISLTKGYVQNLPFEDSSQDLVILRHILEHLGEGYKDVIKEGLRVAYKELVVVFFETPQDIPEDIIDERKSGDHCPDGITHFWNTYSHPRFVEFIASLGHPFKYHFVETPGAAAPDSIFRIIK